jgi:signal transduction histidine kinase
MEALAMNFLDLGRIEAKGIRVFPQRVSLNRIIRDLVDSYAPVFETKQLEGIVELDSALPETSIDPPQLERALSNLLDNAFKFSPQGGRIVCKTAPSQDGLLLTVGDDGPGIGAPQAAALFSRFQNGEDTPGRPSTGLGLYITQAIIAAHGGRISVDLEAHPGACFRIWLPAAVEESPEIAAAPYVVRERVA